MVIKIRKKTLLLFNKTKWNYTCNIWTLWWGFFNKQKWIRFTNQPLSTVHPPQAASQCYWMLPFLNTVFLLMGALVAFLLCSICSQLTDKLNLLADAGRLAWRDPKAVFGEGIFRMKAVSVQLWERIKHGRNSMPKGLFQSPLLTSFAFFSLLFFSPNEFTSNIQCPPFHILQPVSAILLFYTFFLWVYKLYLCACGYVHEWLYIVWVLSKRQQRIISYPTYQHLLTTLLLTYCVFLTCPGVPIYLHSMFWKWVCVYFSP